MPGSPYSKLLILAIYRCHRILSPNIELELDSVGQSPLSNYHPSNMPRLPRPVRAFDTQNLILYVFMHQIFSLAGVPFHHGHVVLTTVLHLTIENTPVTSDPPSPVTSSETSRPTIYLIIKQEDLDQALNSGEVPARWWDTTSRNTVFTAL